MKQKGFTLIELLVVVAIIGILATVVLALLGSARVKAQDSAVQASLSSYRSGIELEFNDGNYTGLCSSYSYYDILAGIQAQGGTVAPGDCESDTAGYRIIAALPSATIATLNTKVAYAAGENAFCINSNGMAVLGIHDDMTSLTAPACTTTEAIAAGTLVSSTEETCFTFSGGTISDYDAVTCGLSVVIPANINGQAVTNLGITSFYNKNLTSVKIPDSVTLIGHAAFTTNNLSSVIIPNSVTSIGPVAFRDNNLTSVTIPANVRSIGQQAFRTNKLTSITILESVLSIDEGCFYENGPNKNSGNMTGFIPNTNQTWNIVGTNWIKQ